MTRFAPFLYLAFGTASVAVGASFISPAGPWFVVGAVLLAMGVAVLANQVRPRT